MCRWSESDPSNSTDNITKAEANNAEPTEPGAPAHTPTPELNWTHFLMMMTTALSVCQFADALIQVVLLTCCHNVRQN